MEKLRLGLQLKLRALVCCLRYISFTHTRLLKLLNANSYFKKLSLHFLRKCQEKNFSFLFPKTSLCSTLLKGYQLKLKQGWAVLLSNISLYH